jgi:transducin (beta)-like 1
MQLWGEAGQRRSISAHRGAITTMAWQPLPPMQPNADDERLIATGGEDCAILIWNARMPEQKAKCFLTMDSPIVRLAFTPDGAFLAGATASQVLIWKVENTAIPRAKWSRPPHPGWLSPNTNSESDVEDEHCLCWDASGQKLAYGSNNRVSLRLLMMRCSDLSANNGCALAGGYKFQPVATLASDIVKRLRRRALLKRA